MLTRRVTVFAALLTWCGVLLAVRIARTGSVSYFFMIWNLFLAAIPAAAAMLFRNGGAHAAAGDVVRGLAAVPAEREIGRAHV